MSWFRYMDMHSGGRKKTQWSCIYVEAETETEASERFQARTGRDPDGETCKCCGSDFSLYEHGTIEEATAYDRGCEWVGTKYVETPLSRSVADYIRKDDVLVIRAGEV